MSAVVLERVGQPVALQIRNLTISVLTPRQVLIKIVSSGLTWSEVRVRVGAPEGFFAFGDRGRLT
jgi:NADPH:quinone reductase-like Zn-dependent oxidoreductase